MKAPMQTPPRPLTLTPHAGVACRTSHAGVASLTSHAGVASRTSHAGVASHAHLLSLGFIEA